jgi:hypothetical protein
MEQIQVTHAHSLQDLKLELHLNPGKTLTAMAMV